MVHICLGSLGLLPGITNNLPGYGGAVVLSLGLGICLGWAVGARVDFLFMGELVRERTKR